MTLTFLRFRPMVRRMVLEKDTGIKRNFPRFLKTTTLVRPVDDTNILPTKKGWFFLHF